jgi:hypothetical protein
VDVRFAFTGHQLKPLDIVAVLTDDTDRSNVLRGENNGRLLHHVSVARSLTRVAKVRDDGEESIHVPLPDGAFNLVVDQGITSSCLRRGAAGSNRWRRHDASLNLQGGL